MNKQIISNPILGDHYEVLQHKSGLTLMLYPMPDFSTTYALLGVGCGSFDTHLPDGTPIPAGVAHFLEHKMFEKPQGDIFAEYGKLGVSANAYTTYERTCYEITCTDRFDEALEILLYSAAAPYFTEESVAKEQGIIAQEILMYADMPGCRIELNMLSAMYREHPIRIDVAGTVDSISHITADLLYRCFDAFYHPSNMVLAVAGPFDPEKILTCCDRYFPQQNTQRSRLIRVLPQEDDGILRREVSDKMEVASPLFQIGWKHRPFSAGNMAKDYVAQNILLEAIAGETSPWYRSLYDNSVINADFGYDAVMEQGVSYSGFSGESRDPQHVADCFAQALKTMTEQGISHREFEMHRRALYGRYVRNFMHPDPIANLMVSGYFSDLDAYAFLNAATEITCEEVNAFLRDYMADSPAVISTILP